MATSVAHAPIAARIPEIRTPLRGRERELAGLREILAAGHPLITIIGPGGVGKTRLAIELARTERRAFGDAVVFVPLAPVRDPQLLLPQVGSAVGFAGDPFGDYEEHLAAFLEDQRALLVLDNLEQVASAAPVLSRLRERAPGLAFLLTSRVALDVPGEVVFPLAPFRVETDAATERLLETEAVALFLERARTSDPLLQVDGDTIRTVARICERVEGLPLAIELAAARMNVMSPGHLLARLQRSFGLLGAEHPDLDARHRTIRDTIAWSYDLLPPTAQALLRQLAVCEGGFAGDVLAVFAAERETLNVLLRHHLVGYTGDDRFLMPESVRDYAQEQLRDHGEEEAARERYAVAIVELVESADLHGPDQLAWGARLDAEMAAIRAVVTWTLDHARRDLLLRLMARLCHYLSQRLYLTEARAWMLEALKDTSPTLHRVRVQALISAGLLWSDRNDYEPAVAYYTQARHLAAAIGDRLLEGQAVGLLGSSYTERGMNDEALPLMQEAATLVRAEDDPREHARIVSNTGNLLFYMGRPLEAMASFERASEVFRAVGDEAFVALDRIKLGTVAADIGRYDEAEPSLLEGIAFKRAAKDYRSLASALGPLAQVYLVRGELEKAADLFRELRDLHREGGVDKWQAEGWIGLAFVALERGDTHGAAVLLLHALELLVDGMDDYFVIAPEDLAALLLVQGGDAVDAARVLGSVRHRLGESGQGVSDFNRRLLDRVEEGVRAQLAPEEVTRLMADGRTITMDDLNREVQRMVRAVIGRQRPDVDRPAATMPVDEPVPVETFGLTKRELETLGHVAAGRSTQEIAEAMAISTRTVATHVANILAKMEVGSRTAAVARAMQLGLVSPL